MGSLNGDTMIIRNGRSTSQVSVYNYPEHLNPFYEDDQHKRLRFWKISKKDNEGRRNSFSIANLKDIWAFKSFRMKKKSSTLGINKTSESPPLLRRDYGLDNGWNTFDNRLRASNTSSINGDSFQRNATYRSSLQTLPTAHDRIGLNRNDGYRSTIQVPRTNSRYQPQQMHQQSHLGVSQNRRSSQSSMVSTNPFESDDDDENEDPKSGMRSVINGSITTLTSRTPRKKRRAPAPPTPIHGSNNGVNPPTIIIESSQDNIQDELHIKEDMDIANLTAEIESFVKTKSNDDIEETPTVEVIKTANNKENLQDLKVKEENQLESVTLNTNIITQDMTTLPKEIVNMTEKANGQVTIETVAATTTSKTEPDVIKPGQNTLTLVSSEIETKSKENIDIKTNGAIPKKPNKNTVSHNNNKPGELKQPNQIAEELCIKETCTEEIDMPPKPIPLKRQTKPETEVGQVECIHVHIESPKASPRQDHPNGLTSFKATECVESTDTITTKTSFVLTSPPTQRRKHQQNESVEPLKKETVKIIETNTKGKLANELNIQEEHVRNKPEILDKPALSPKPVTKNVNGKLPGYADIHKPMRKHSQNGHIVKAAREGSISPPFVPQHKIKNDEEKINNTDQFNNKGSTEEKSPVTRSLHFRNLDNLKIVETTITVKSNSDFKEEEEEKEKLPEGERNNNSVSISAALHQHEERQKRDDELDLLYRPKPSSYMEWKCSTLAPLETNIPPEKRKSVKDIIESINRSQRLLNAAANKDFPALQNQNTTTNNTGCGTTAHQTSLNYNTNSNLNEDLKNLTEQQDEFEHMTRSLKREDIAMAANSPSPSPSNDNNDNNEIFQKCKVNKEVFDYRETSPITSNLDWNPVPKPKRTKAAQD